MPTPDASSVGSALLQGKEDYGEIQRHFAEHLPKEIGLYNEYHALIVQLGKNVVDPSPAVTSGIYKHNHE